MSLGEYLGTNQDVHFPILDALAHRLPGTATARRVAVDSQNARPGKMAHQRLFHALGTLPDRCQVGIAAVGAGNRRWCDVPAMVAVQAAIGHVQNELCRAAVAS